LQENEKVNFPIEIPSRSNNDEVIEDVESGHADSNKHVSKQPRNSIVSFDIPTTRGEKKKMKKTEIMKRNKKITSIVVGLILLTTTYSPLMRKFKAKQRRLRRVRPSMMRNRNSYTSMVLQMILWTSSLLARILLVLLREMIRREQVRL
jgi:hypothetical protein